MMLGDVKAIGRPSKIVAPKPRRVLPLPKALLYTLTECQQEDSNACFKSVPPYRANVKADHSPSYANVYPLFRPENPIPSEHDVVSHDHFLNINYKNFCAQLYKDSGIAHSI